MVTGLVEGLGDDFGRDDIADLLDELGDIDGFGDMDGFGDIEGFGDINGFGDIDGFRDIKETGDTGANDSANIDAAKARGVLFGVELCHILFSIKRIKSN